MDRLKQLEEDENQLKLRGVPQCYWLYVAHNGIGDGLGTWVADRQWILKDMETHPNSLKYNAVDGRKKETLLQFMDTSWNGHCSFKKVGSELVPLTAEDWDKEWNEWLVKATSKCLKLTVKVSATLSYTVELDDTATVRHLKESVQLQMDVPVANQRLVYTGCVLTNEKTLESYQMKTGQMVHLILLKAESTSPEQQTTPKE